MNELFGKNKRPTKAACPLVQRKNKRPTNAACPLVQRKNYFNKLKANKNAANKNAYARAAAKMKANRNAKNPNIILPGESWGNVMNRINKITAASKRK